MIFPRMVTAALVAAAIVSMAAGVPRAADGPWTTFLRARTFTDVLVDTNQVWCASLEGGLLRFDRGSRTFESIAREPGGLASNRLTTMALDRSNRLWIGTQGGGLSRLSADRVSWGLVNEFDGLPSDTVNVITAQGDTLWIGTPRGLALWNGREVLGTLPDGVNPSPFRSNNITGVVIFGDSVFVGTLDGVYRSQLSSRLAVWTDVASDSLPTRRVEALVGDGRDLFAFSSEVAWGVPYRLSGADWVRQGGLGGVRAIHERRQNILVTTGAGLFRWDGVDYRAVPDAPISRTDRTLWIEPGLGPDGQYYGANRDGLYEQVASGTWPSYFAPQPPGNNINNVLVSGGRTYVNTFDEGVGRFDGSQWKYWFSGSCRLPTCDPDSAFQNSAFAFALVEGADQRVWFSTWGEIANPDRNPGAIERLDDTVNPPAFERTNQWPDTLVVASIRHTFAVGSTRDSLGGIWFGMDSAERENPAYVPIGIDRYDPSGDWVRNYNPSNSLLRTGRIMALTTDRNGRIWVATTGGGIQFFDWAPNDTGPRFLAASPDDRVDVRGIVAAGDSIWAQTTNDVRIYSRSTAGLRATLPVPAGPSDIAGNTMDVALDGSVWVGTVNGIRVYDPDGSIRTDYTIANSPIGSDEIKAIRVDRLTGQVWVGTSAGLSRFDPSFVPTEPEVPALDVRVYPNPARLTNIGSGLRLSGNVSAYFGAVYDLGGRLVNSFRDVPNGGVVWNGFDQDGRPVRPGIYFVHVRSGSRSTLVRAVMLR